VPPREIEQRRLKAQLLAEAAGAKFLAFDAMTVGDGDLAFGVDFLREMAEQHGLPYVSANVRTMQGDAIFPSYLVLERGGKRIGITGLLSESHSLGQALVDPAIEAGAKVVRALRDEEKVDLVIVLSHLGLTEDKKLAAAVPDIDLIFGGHSRRHQETPAIVGDTAIFQAGSRGKNLGEAALLLRSARGWANPGAKPLIERQRALIEKQVERFRSRLTDAQDETSRKRIERVLRFNEKKLVALVVPPDDDGTRSLIAARKIDMNRAIVDETAMAALVDATLEKLGPALAAEAEARGKRGAQESARVKTMGDWVGANACRSCHQTQFEDWRTTPHARAYVTLLRERRQNDLDCWSCHVTGAEQPGGPQSPLEVGFLRNVQCESCHGPGRKHLEDPAEVDMVRNPGEAHCKGCHSDEQTEGRFVFADYLPKVDHSP
jgi:hypothetical protein